MDNRSLLKKADLRITAPRLALIASLRDAKKPLTAEELHAKNSTYDLVTVYRTVKSLAEAALVREVRLKDASRRYEFADSETHHHHLICSGCGFIEELPDCESTLPEKKVLRNSSRFVSVEEHVLEFFGTCKSCS